VNVVILVTSLFDPTVVGAELPCRSDPELFFAESPDDVEFAKTLCLSCPVRAACLAGAKERREPWGVWGGELFVSGAVVPRKRPRGRPRKVAIAT
jgi:WhiB family transcriptional regulator, redox-sensing transcriptional regulator